MLITPYRAAKEAKVSKQTIYDQIRKKPHTAYFVEVANGRIMIDNDHPLWKNYLTKLKIGGRPRWDTYEVMGRIMVDVLQEKLNIEIELLEEILDEIDRRYSARAIT